MSGVSGVFSVCFCGGAAFWKDGTAETTCRIARHRRWHMLISHPTKRGRCQSTRQHDRDELAGPLDFSVRPDRAPKWPQSCIYTAG